MRRQRPAAEDSPLAPARLSPGLGVTGFLMLVAVFVTANPWFGAVERVWPWELFVRGQHSTLVRAIFGLWVATAFLMLALSFTESIRLRAFAGVALGAALLVECTGGAAGFVIEDFNLNKMVPMILIGGGFLIGRQPSGRGLGATLAGCGALLLFWALVAAFPEKTLAETQLGAYVREMGLVFADPSADVGGRINHLWWTLIPQTIVFLSAAMGLLALLGLRGRRFMTAGFIVMVMGLLAPGVAGLVLELRGGGGMRGLLLQLNGAFVSHGFLLWLLLTFSAADLAKLREEPA